MKSQWWVLAGVGVALGGVVGFWAAGHQASAPPPPVSAGAVEAPAAPRSPGEAVQEQRTESFNPAPGVRPTAKTAMEVRRQMAAEAAAKAADAGLPPPTDPWGRQ